MKKILISILAVFIVLAGIFVVKLVRYNNEIKEDLNAMEYFKTVRQANPGLLEKDSSFDIHKETFSYSENSYYRKFYKALEPHLLMHNVYKNNKKINLVKIDDELVSFYLVPELAFKEADILLGYGIDHTILFENNFAKIYNKPSYAFDCGITKESIEGQITSPLFTFSSECIGNDNRIYPWQVSSGKSHTFEQKIAELNAQDKKVYVKMCIMGTEREVLYDIMKHPENITGITVAFFLNDTNIIMQALKILENMEKDFVLVYRGDLCHYGYDNITLTYINKNLIDKSTIPLNQSNKVKYTFLGDNGDKLYLIPHSTITPIAVVSKNLNDFYQKVFKKKKIKSIYE